MQKFTGLIAMTLLLGATCGGSVAFAQAQAQGIAQGGKAQAALDEGAKTGKLTFIVFSKEDNPAVRKMTETVNAGVKKHEGKAHTISVSVSSPSEQAVVDRYQLSRAPMPLTLAIAPNGAMTGIFAKEITAERFEDAFVTPTMMTCMKSLQEDRLVFVCVQKSDKGIAPGAIKDLQLDPQFKDRIVVVSLNSADPAETKFLGQMKIDPQQPMLGTTAVLLAPPGVMIGKYDATSTAAQIAGALHAAGKCCNDPNCKHNHAPAPQATRPTASKRN